MTAYVVQRRTVTTEHGDIEADSLDDAWEIWDDEGSDLLDYSDWDKESSVEIVEVEDVKELSRTAWDMKSCPQCGSSRSLEVDQMVTPDSFLVYSNCCSVQWVVEGEEMAAACDPAWKDVV